MNRRFERNQVYMIGQTYERLCKREGVGTQARRGLNQFELDLENIEFGTPELGGVIDKHVMIINEIKSAPIQGGG